MSATPPLPGSSVEPQHQQHLDSISDVRVGPSALRNVDELTGEGSLRDPVNLVRRLQRSLQLQERDLEPQSASARGDALAKGLLGLQGSGGS